MKRLLSCLSFLLLVACVDKGTSDDSGVIDIDTDTSPSDQDGDGYTTEDGDCDDSDSDISPDADEVCDGLDNDCDTLVDDADDSVTDQGMWYSDGDSDGFGDEGAAIAACGQPSGTIDIGGDCDDSDAGVNPSAVESCQDGSDTDCDGSGDETCTACGDLSVIAYYDSFFSPPLSAAATALGMTVSATDNSSTFSTNYALSTWDVLIVDVPGSSMPTDVQTVVATQLASGGGLIFSYWSLNNDSALQATLGVRVTRSFNSPLPLYSSHSLWSLYESLPLPISNYSHDAGDNGDVIEPLDAGTSEVLASFDAKGTEAAILATFSGQVIVNGFLPWDYQATDDNGNGTSDMIELYTNEILWMLNCTP